jgi:hypothetical protein
MLVLNSSLKKWYPGGWKKKGQFYGDWCIYHIVFEARQMLQKLKFYVIS